MKTSARNQFIGKVYQIRTGAINDEIDIELPGGDRLSAVITRTSTESRGLKVGSQATALIKAPWVMVVTESDNVKFSARNNLAGTVESVTPGAVNTEVKIKLQGGNTVCAIITNDSAKELNLVPGTRARALFKASHVILAVP